MPTSAREEPRIRRSVPRFGKLFCRADVGIGPYNFSRLCRVIVNSEKTPPRLFFIHYYLLLLYAHDFF